MRNLYYIILLFIIMIGSKKANCQTVDSTYIHYNDSVYVFGNDSVSNWGNLYHNGSAGSDTLAALIHFGEAWKNSTTASLPDANHGGTFIFTQPRPAPYNNNVSQNMEGGFGINVYNGCMFPNVILNNDQNLELANNDFKTKYIFRFDTGHVILSGNNMIVGNGDPGKIQGYSETRFVVNGTDTVGGYLYREGIENTSNVIRFPIGSSIGDYTPAAIYNVGTSDTFRMRVFNNVYTQATNGSTTNVNTVGKTWDVIEQTPTGSNARLFLEHKKTSEGIGYNRTNQYIARYIGQLHNTFGGANSQNSYWDLVNSGNCTGNSTPGAFTSATPIVDSYDALRGFNHDSDFNTFHYFTKTVCALPLPVNMISFEAKWYQESRLAKLNWQTTNEQNCAGFWIERQLQGEHTYTPIAWVPSTGNTNTTSNYIYNDYYTNELSNYTGIAFYRLKQVDNNAKFEYTDIRSVYIEANNNLNIKVWPNPSAGLVNITIPNVGNTNAKLYDISGKLMQSFQLKGEITNTINIEYLPAGIYFLRMGDEVVRVEKL